MTGKLPLVDRQAEVASPLEIKSALRSALAAIGPGSIGGLRAVILTGSVARGEATVRSHAGRLKILGDAELLLVFHKGARLPDDAGITRLRAGMTTALDALGIGCPLSLSAVHPRYFECMRPHIFGYELRAHGHVLWGDSAMLSLIPGFTEADIPREDAWRMLGNRMVELLEALAGWTGEGQAMPAEVFYRANKLLLDSATSFLLFHGLYRPSYRERAQALSRLADEPPAGFDCPFRSLRRFSARIDECTRFKLEGESSEEDAAGLLDEAVAGARLLWRWELARMTGQPALPDRALMDTWMKMQPAAARVRGWLYVARRQGWRAAGSQWRRWLRLAAKASPRYLVYSAASELLFSLPRSGGPDPTCGELRNWLPSASLKGDESWRRIAQEIAWNYHEFLEMTRA